MSGRAPAVLRFAWWGCASGAVGPVGGGSGPHRGHSPPASGRGDPHVAGDATLCSFAAGASVACGETPVCPRAAPFAAIPPPWLRSHKRHKRRLTRDAEAPPACAYTCASLTTGWARTKALFPPPTGPHSPNRPEGACRGPSPQAAGCPRFTINPWRPRNRRTRMLASPRDSRSARTTATASRTIRPRSTASPCSPRRTSRACSRSISSSAETYTVIFSSCRSRPLGRRFAPRPRRRAGAVPSAAVSAASCRRRPFGAGATGAAASAPRSRPPCSAGAEPSGSPRRGFVSSPGEDSAGPPGAGTRGASPLTPPGPPPFAAAGPLALRGAGDCSPDPPVVRNNSSAPGRLTRRDTGRAPPWPADGRRRRRRSWTRTW